MKYLMDTDHITVLQRQAGPDFTKLTLKLGRQSPADLGFSIVSFHEQVMGCNTYINQSRQHDDTVRGYRMLDRTLRSYSTAPVLPFDEIAASMFAELVSQKIRVATMDLRIATIAISRGLILLTRNLRDFGKVPGLLTEDWTA